MANILEGSVQKSADQVCVNVQLIQAASDSHLWADTYDRKLIDIFAVESEIAKTIAETLRAKLTDSEEHALSFKPTADPAAHQLYLKGRYFWNKRTGDDLKKALDYFNQAIAADPKYALAYTGAAEAYVLLPIFAEGTPQESYPKAKEAAKKALELDDTLAEAHTSLAMAICYYDFDLAKATREFQRAIALDPSYATAHQWYGITLMAYNRHLPRRDGHLGARGWNSYSYRQVIVDLAIEGKSVSTRDGVSVRPQIFSQFFLHLRRRLKRHRV